MGIARAWVGYQRHSLLWIPYRLHTFSTPHTTSPYYTPTHTPRTTHCTRCAGSGLGLLHMGTAAGGDRRGRGVSCRGRAVPPRGVERASSPKQNTGWHLALAFLAVVGFTVPTAFVCWIFKHRTPPGHRARTSPPLLYLPPCPISRSMPHTPPLPPSLDHAASSGSLCVNGSCRRAGHGLPSLSANILANVPPSGSSCLWRTASACGITRHHLVRAGIARFNSTCFFLARWKTRYWPNALGFKF